MSCLSFGPDFHSIEVRPALTKHRQSTTRSIKPGWIEKQTPVITARRAKRAKVALIFRRALSYAIATRSCEWPCNTAFITRTH